MRRLTGSLPRTRFGPLPAGMIGHASGPVMAATDSAQVVLYGQGGHGSRAEAAASEDVGIFGEVAGVPAVFWFWGGPHTQTVLSAMAEGRLDSLPGIFES